MALRWVFISYILDWMIIIAATGIALALSTVNPDFHPFCLLDLSISFPQRNPKVSPGLFIFLAIIIPILFIVTVSLTLSPKPASPQQVPRDQIWRRKLWELNAGFLGLGVSLATATVICTGVKNLTGKPRPDFLVRCQPDLEHVSAYVVGGMGHTLSSLWVLVDQEICQQPDKKWLNDGFRSFPSGYATISFAGLWYLTLYICAKFDISIPSRSVHDRNARSQDADEPLLRTEHRELPQEQHAARPAFLLPLSYVPFGLAIFISGTRYFDFTNHGFDVLAGAAIGACTAWLGFRWYHPKLSDHVRSAWPPRGHDRRFHNGDHSRLEN